MLPPTAPTPVPIGPNILPNAAPDAAPPNELVSIFFCGPLAVVVVLPPGSPVSSDIMSFD